MTGLMRGLGIDANLIGKLIMKGQQVERWGKHNIAYGSRARKIKTVAKPLAVIGTAVGLAAALPFYKA